MSCLGKIQFIPSGEVFDVLEQFGEVDGRDSDVGHGVFGSLLSREVDDDLEVCVLLQNIDPMSETGGYLRLLKFGDDGLVDKPITDFRMVLMRS